MRLLFVMDKKDYEHCTHRFVRNSARSIIIRDGKIAMIHSLKYDYYKFPGGGIENGENPVEAMIRETREEAGLVVKPETVKEYGYVHRIQRSDKDASECFVQDNYYYLCEAEPEAIRQDLDAYEAQEAYTLEYVTPLVAIQKNRSVGASPYNPMMFEREARVLELLISEGCFRLDAKAPLHEVLTAQKKRTQNTMLIRKATCEEMLRLWGNQDTTHVSPTARFFYQNISTGNAVFWTLDHGGELIGELYIFSDLDDKDFAEKLRRICAPFG
ncbi:MAG: NUDIX domain-containing protein [Clostridia bacterium]|nr:NUDIX domain-containing protein [Clostridia bacterium]